MNIFGVKGGRFKIGEKEIPAHKEILIKRSKFFANLFNSTD